MRNQSALSQAWTSTWGHHQPGTEYPQPAIALVGGIRIQVMSDRKAQTSGDIECSGEHMSGAISDRSKPEHGHHEHIICRHWAGTGRRLHRH